MQTPIFSLRRLLCSLVIAVTLYAIVHHDPLGHVALGIAIAVLLVALWIGTHEG
jgi:hypothetical protein